ncbi:hypothetical protein C2I27_22875 [Priestia megaterium]|uniref:hypothetical protein n=1 Tax=Priestia megaterium TaxID=1404 RepID=UPI000D51B78E|nr:hypothetical protein [Priestia megaterium]PVC63335.1 hypothetical protein C2I27_22875 [Priestia megaterium]
MESVLHGNSGKVNERATCNRLAVGCFLVRDNRIIGSAIYGSITVTSIAQKRLLGSRRNGKVGCKTIHASIMQFFNVLSMVFQQRAQLLL